MCGKKHNNNMEFCKYRSHTVNKYNVFVYIIIINYSRGLKFTLLIGIRFNCNIGNLKIDIM